MTAPDVEVAWTADERPDDFRRLLNLLYGDEPSDPTPDRTAETARPA